MTRLAHRVALVSGAGRNNGAAIATKFAAEGADLVLVARSRNVELEDVAERCRALGAGVLPLLADMTVPAEVERVVGAALDRFGAVDVAVNVLGLRPRRSLLETDYEEWKAAFAVNCDSLFLLTKAVAPSMIERRRGSIVALGGMAASWALPLRGAVVASKHALHGLVKSLALELGPHGIRVNLLNPGHIENVRADPEAYSSFVPDVEGTPLRRIGANEEVAEVAVFLASDQSSFVTGDRILVAGGRYM
jgi:NAD(P)-dependent dehydrogenase (short-subunit alcohol dehydrogenase family)